MEGNVNNGQLGSTSNGNSGGNVSKDKEYGSSYIRDNCAHSGQLFSFERIKRSQQSSVWKDHRKSFSIYFYRLN